MAKFGKKVSDIKNANRSLLLNILYFDGAQSRKALAQKSSLTPAAITGLMSELIAQDAVIETDKISTEGRLGRSEQLIDINYPSLYVVGIRFESDSFEISLVRLDSKIKAKKTICLPSLPLVKSSFGKLILVAVRDILAEAAVVDGRIVGIGVTVGGIVDSENGVSINSQGILENNLNIAELMKTPSFPVTVENDLRAMLRSDSILRHAKPLQSTLFVRYGPDVGAAFLVGQDNFVGSNYRAIELAHTCVEANGDKCSCGRKGCLETVVSYESIVNNAQKILDRKSVV